MKIAGIAIGGGGCGFVEVAVHLNVSNIVASEYTLRLKKGGL